MMGWSERLAFRAWLFERRYAETTVRQYLEYAARFHEHQREQGSTLRRATVDDILAFLRTLPTTATSWNGARKSLIAYYRFAGRRAGGPAAELEHVPEKDALPRALDPELHDRFLRSARALGPIHHVVGLTFATTGCRFSEMRSARWHQFDLVSPVATWEIIGKGAACRGPRLRRLPLHSQLVPILRSWKATCGSAEWFLPGHRLGTRMSEGSLRAVFREICAVDGLDGTVPHQLRHTAASVAIERGANVREVQEFLGHRDLNSTQRYLRVQSSRLQSLVEALPAEPG
jgi:integrase